MFLYSTPHCQSTSVSFLLPINPCPSPPHCQSSRIPPIPTVNHPWYLDSNLHCQPPWVPPLILSINPCPSPPHCLSPWVHLLPSSLSITLGTWPFLSTVNHPWSSIPLLNVNNPGYLPTKPHCQSPGVLPLPSPLSVTPGSSHPFLTVTLPGFLPSPL